MLPLKKRSKFTDVPLTTVAGALAVTIVIFVTAGLLGFYSTQQQSMRREALDLEQAYADGLAAQIDSYMARLAQSTETYAKLLSSTKDPVLIEQMAVQFIASMPPDFVNGVGAYYTANAIYPDQTYYAPYAYFTGDPNEPIVLGHQWEAPDYDYLTQDWYLASIDATNDVVFWEPYADIDNIYMGFEHAIIDENGKIIGGTSIDVVLSKLINLVAEANEGSDREIYLTTGSGKVVIHTEEASVLDFAKANGSEPSYIIDLTKEDVEAYYKQNSEAQYTGVSADIATVGWTLHTATDTNILFAQTYMLRNQIFAIIGGLWLTLGVVLVLLTRLGKQMKAQKDQQAVLERELVAQEASQATLMQANSVLEAKVIERTAELETARDEALAASRMKSEFLASMSHELRTPLNAILNFNEMVATGIVGEVNDEQRELLGISLNSAQHLLGLINDVLDMSKIQSGMLTLFKEDNIDLQEEIRTVTATAQALVGNKPIQLISEVDPNLPNVSGDKRRIRQILLNLVSNAIKFTASGTVALSAKEENGEVVFTIADTGSGIAHEDQMLIFEPFIQTQEGVQHANGTGLGLPITKWLTEAHGGRIWVESEAGSGSTFYVALPASNTSSVGSAVSAQESITHA